MKKVLLLLSLILLTLAFIACEEDDATSQVVNIYTDRHYDTDQALYDAFTESTGIEVNIVKASSDELIVRLQNEGQDTEADLMVTSDVGRLYRAQSEDLIKPFDSEIIENQVPENLREKNNHWTALTMRARVIAYAKDRINPEDLSTYEALLEDQWQGKVLTRSSTNIYNQSLMASFIAIKGPEESLEFAKGLVNNMARSPEGNDRDQMKAVVAGAGDLAIVNTYYLGKLLNSSDPYEVEVGEKIGIFFPNQLTTGTHINISGAALTKHGKNSEEALQLIEYLTGESAQEDYANANYEYPVNPNVQPSELLQSWGPFIAQDIDLSLLGQYNVDAVKLMNEAGWE
jgi:iron(III) transport system substrate-binding protein